MKNQTLRLGFRRWCRAALITAMGVLAAVDVATAQLPGEVRGQVYAEEAEQPLPGAHVALEELEEEEVVAGAVTNGSGRFRLDNVPAGQYIVVVTQLGYDTLRTAALRVEPGDTVDLGTLSVPVQALKLESISVRTAHAPADFAADRSIYRTDDMPVASGGSATEILRGVPELEVGINGDVSLRGATPEIHIDGRPVPMEGEALNMFLEQFPADRIDRVEVIPNPGGRFNAEGSAGIVNIVLKNDMELGLSASVFANTGSRGDIGGGGRLSWQGGDWTISGGGHLWDFDLESTTFDERQNLLADPPTHLQKDAESHQGRLSGSLDMNVERRLGDPALIWMDGRLHRGGNQMEELSRTAHLDLARDTVQLYDRINESEVDRLSANFATGFRYEWQPRRHVLEAELGFALDNSDENERVETEWEIGSGDWPDLAGLTLEALEEQGRELTAELDYVRPWGEEGRLEVGYRGEVEDEEDDRLLTLHAHPEPGSGEEAQSMLFSFQQVFHSVYATGLRRFGRLGLQVGLRAERAQTSFEVPEGGHHKNSYNSLFPSGNISYTTGDGQELRLSYSRRIRRPSPTIMNPIDQSTDPLNRRAGNPHVEPEYTHSVSLDANWTGAFGTLAVSPYYRNTDNAWAEIKNVDEEGVSAVTWQNVASREDYGASVTASIRPVNGWGGFLSVSAGREVRDASNLTPEYSGGSMTWSVQSNLTGELGRGLSAQGMFAYLPARDLPQGRISSRIVTHFGVRQDLLDGRASLRLAVVDPFDLFDLRFETRDATHVQVGQSEFKMRRVRLSLSYAFGSDPDSVREPEGPEDAREQAERIR